jgi:Ni,Fe-hydrogenase III large subunit/Ni,Fe-hydrogenase III component G
MTDFSDLTFIQGETQGKTLHTRIERQQVPDLASRLHTTNLHLILLLANDQRATRQRFELVYLFEDFNHDRFVQVMADVPPADPTFPSLATFHYPASRYEREIADTFGLQPQGHPDLRRLTKHQFWPADYYPLRKDSPTGLVFEDTGEPYPFQPVDGEGIYEIPVGPVHAGVIEPGHFRFNVLGETIIDMHSRLYFVHKGIEKLFEGKMAAEGVPLAERISGDSAVGHNLAYCQAIEALAGVEAPRYARLIRTVLLELERLYNHVSDFGFICADTGFVFANAHAMRLKERLMRLNARVAGHRLLRGIIVPGGVSRGLPDPSAIQVELDAVLAEFNQIVELAWGNTMLLDRLQTTGRLLHPRAADHGVLGYVARASGIDRDVRRDHPFAGYQELEFQVVVKQSEDVYARTLVRVEECRESVAIIRQALARLKEMPPAMAEPLLPLLAGQTAFGLVEGWRGAIVHWVQAGEQNTLHRVKIKDPSFVNWPALSFALLTNIVPDFPLCNKSFNLSYAGNDL